MTRRGQADTPPSPASSHSRWLEYVPLDELVPADSNPKDHDAQLLDTSLEDHGYVEPINEDGRTGKLIAGHGRLEALRRAEEQGPPDAWGGEQWPPEGIEVGEDGRWLVPVVKGWRSRDDRQARAYLVVANRATERGGWKRRELAEYLHAQTELDQEAAALERMGFADTEYEALLKDTGLAGELAGGFLDDIAAGNGSGDAEAPSRGQSTDVVTFRVPMVDRDRDAAVALLREHQRKLSEAGRPSSSLADTLLEVLRTWQP